MLISYYHGCLIEVITDHIDIVVKQTLVAAIIALQGLLLQKLIDASGKIE